MGSKLFQMLLYGVVPVIGIAFFGWDWRQVIILYWLENITVGIGSVIAMLRAPNSEAQLKEFQTMMKQNTGSQATASNDQPSIDLQTQQLAKSGAMKYFLAGFFCLHYGGFTFIHGIFVFSMASGAFGPAAGSDSSFLADNILPILGSWLAVSTVQIILLIMRPVESSGTLRQSFTNPYKRIIALHFSIIFGAFAIALLNLPSAAALLLIVIHVALDLRAFHKNSKASAPQIQSNNQPLQ